MDSKRKSIVKTITWRVIAMIISYIVTYLFIKSSSMSFGIVIIANVISMVGYYFHERAWNNYN